MLFFNKTEFFFSLDILLSFASPKESNKEKETTKTNSNFFFHTKPAKTWLEKIVVRTFRGHQPHPTEFRNVRWPEKGALNFFNCLLKLTSRTPDFSSGGLSKYLSRA